MGKTIVLDTNILFGLWTNYNETVKRVPEINTHKLYIIVFCYIKMLAATPERHKKKTRKFLIGFELLSFGTVSIEIAKTISYHKVTDKANFIDLFIFSNTKAVNNELLTFNVNDFQRFL